MHSQKVPHLVAITSVFFLMTAAPAFAILTQPQTINVTETAPATAIYGSTFSVSATGGTSGNPVMIASSGGCSGSGQNSATITMTSGTNQCEITFDQAGNLPFIANATEVTEIVSANKAAPTISISGYNVIFDNGAHSAVGTATGVNAEDLSPDLDLSQTTHTDAGDYTDNWNFLDPNGNYLSQTGTVDDSISAAPVTTYTLTYTAGANGSTTGSATQSVASGSNGTAVTAVADPGYEFDSWSDGSTQNPRTDTDVTSDLNVTANFSVVPPVLSSDADITTFGLGVAGEVDSPISGTDIEIAVPSGTDVTSLTPSIALSVGATVSPNSGVSADFTNPVQYMVTAQDGIAQQVYTVTVTVEAAPAATVTSVDPISDITVTQGTDLAGIGLPTTVTAEMSDGSTQSANVVWDGGSPAYDGKTAATYAFTGTLSGVNNPGNSTANVNVTVKALLTPLLTVSAPSLVYTAAPQDVTLHASYAGSTIGGTFSNVEYNGSAIAPTNVGTYAVTADFAPTDTADYSSVTGVSAGNFSITPAPLTITAQTNSKVYDGSKDAAATPLISGLLHADTGSATEMYDTATVGTNKTLNVASYTIQDGNAGNNYTVATVSDTTGVILTLTHSLNYSAGANGSITGNTAQTVDDGMDGTMVTAVPDSGFQFTSWSDGVTSASRTDTDVTADISVTANFSAIPAPVTSGGGGGGGGNGAVYGSGTFAPTVLPNNGGATTTPSTTGEVLGASAYNFKVDFGIGTQDEDVTQLQLILIAGGYLDIPAPTSYFGVMTKAAVKTYQSAHGITPVTGYVGPKTRATLNEGTLSTTLETDSSTTTTIAQLQNQLQILEAEVVAFGK